MRPAGPIFGSRNQNVKLTTGQTLSAESLETSLLTSYIQIPITHVGYIQHIISILLRASLCLHRGIKFAISLAITGGFGYFPKPRI